MISADTAHVPSGSSSLPGLRSRPGFSLLELIVTCILVGIVAAVSTGRITSMRAQQQVTRSAGQIQTQMEKAFAIAGRNRAPVHIVYDPTQMTLSVTNRAETVTFGVPTRLGSDFGLTSSEVTASQSSVEVYPSGFAHDTLSITISTIRGSSTYTKRVRMSRAGLVKVI
jgi:prepilin-type N-terminal cleavage/methylation domain-containing protein